MGSQRVRHNWATFTCSWQRASTRGIVADLGRTIPSVSRATVKILSLLSRALSLEKTLCSNSVQAPLSIAFSRWKYRTGLPFSPSGDLPDPVIKLESPVSPALVGFFTTEPPGKPSNLIAKIKPLINVWWESWLNDWHTVSAYWIWSKNVICMKYINLKIIIWGRGYHLYFTMDKETEIKDW